MASLSKGEIQQRKLFDAAARLFAEKGYHGASLADLSRALGLRKSSLYHYMESKEDLLYRLLDDYISQALEQLEELAGRDLEPADKLKQVLEFYARFYVSDPARLVLLVNETTSLSGWRKQELLAKQRRYLGVFKSIFAQLRDQGLLREIPESVAAFSFFGMVHYSYQWFSGQGELSADQLAEMFYTIFTRGVLLPGGERRQ